MSTSSTGKTMSDTLPPNVAQHTLVGGSLRPHTLVAEGRIHGSLKPYTLAQGGLGVPDKAGSIAGWEGGSTCCSISSSSCKREEGGAEVLRLFDAAPACHTASPRAGQCAQRC